MRIRTDFVTNSSSSSFVGYGVNLADVLKSITTEKVKSLYPTYMEGVDNDMPVGEMLDLIRENIDDDYEFAEALNTDVLGVSVFDGDSCIDEYIIAITPDTLRKKFADRKIGEIEQVVAEEVNKEFGTSFTEKDVDYYEEAWY